MSRRGEAGGPYSRAAGRTALPSPSRLHLPRHPRFPLAGVQGRGIPRDGSVSNLGLLLPGSAQGSRRHPAPAAAWTGSPLEHVTSRPCGGQYACARRSGRGASTGDSKGGVLSVQAIRGPKRVVRRFRGLSCLRKYSRHVTCPCPIIASLPSFLPHSSPRLPGTRRPYALTPSLRPSRRRGGADALFPRGGASLLATSFPLMLCNLSRGKWGSPYFFHSAPECTFSNQKAG